MKARTPPRWVVTITHRGALLGAQQFASSLAHVYAIVESIEASEPDACSVAAVQLRPDGTPQRFGARLWTRDASGSLRWQGRDT